MKTKMNTSNLKKATVTVIAFLMINTGIFAQPAQDNTGSSYIASLVRLEALMNVTAQSLRYVAPLNADCDDVNAALDNIDFLNASMETSLQYSAADYVEIEETHAAMNQLEVLCAETASKLRYDADDYTAAEKLSYEEVSLHQLFDAEEESLKYNPPAAEMLFASELAEANTNEIILADMLK